jgi:hypothetical protein
MNDTNVYLKKLTPQELGYRKGRLMTGQYFYISKSAIGPFFHDLSKEIVNDFLTLNFDDPLENGSTINASFVYHNDKFSRENGTRDEYRIYLNREIAKHDLHFQPNDIIALVKLGDDKLELQHFGKRNEVYKKLLKLIEKSKIRGNHALISEHDLDLIVSPT